MAYRGKIDGPRRNSLRPVNLHTACNDCVVLYSFISPQNVIAKKEYKKQNLDRYTEAASVNNSSVPTSWQKTEINGESTSMVWPTLGSRTAKEPNRTNLMTLFTGLSLLLSSALVPLWRLRASIFSTSCRLLLRNSSIMLDIVISLQKHFRHVLGLRFLTINLCNFVSSFWQPAHDGRWRLAGA